MKLFILDDSNKGNKMKPGVIAAIAIAVVVTAALIALIALFIFKKCKNNQIDEEDVETLDDRTNVTSTDNPHYNRNGATDPFKEDFN